MDPLHTMGQEDMEPEGSAITLAFINTSSDIAINHTNITYFPYYQHSLFVAVGYILVYFLIFLLCMVGNILVCLIVLENRRMRTVTNLFILNLAISDLLVGIFCIPTTLVDNLITGWPFSNNVCKMSGFIQGVSVSSSVFTLVAIAAERFRCIVYPLRPKPTILVAHAAIMSIWMLAMVIMCPAAVALSVEKVPFNYMVHNNDYNNTMPLYICYENFSNPQMRKVYTAVLFAYIYMLPLSVISIMYGCIGVKLYTSVVANREQLADGPDQVGRRRGGQRISQKKIRVIKMLLLVAVLFMLSWLPLWTLMMMTDYSNLEMDELDLLTGYIFPFAHWLAFANSSINPIIYGYYNENFKRGFQAVCKSWPVCRFLHCKIQKGMARWGKKETNGPSDPGGSGRNQNHLMLGVRNRVHNDNKLSDNAEGERSRVGCVVVQPEQGLAMALIHKKSSSGEESDRMGTGGVQQAWEN